MSPKLAVRTEEEERKIGREAGSELGFAGLAGQADLLRQGDISSPELTQYCLERIARLEPQINAFRIVMAEEAMAEAAKAQDRLDRGEHLPLLGVPIAIKDDNDVKGHSTMLGTGIDNGPASADCVAVRRLREAGAIIIGKTHMPEIGAFPMCESLTWGTTRNPWDFNRTSGGSSGGSAAAVATGMVAGALGSDGGGSVRIPAAGCGIFGLKSQRGRVSTVQAPEREYRFHGLPHLGPLTRSVLDGAIFNDAMTGPEPGDWIPSPPPTTPLAEAAMQTPRPMRIAISYDTMVPGTRVDDSVKEPVEATAELLRSLGHEVVETKTRYPKFGSMSIGLGLMHGANRELNKLPDLHLLETRTKKAMKAGGMVPIWFADKMYRHRQRLIRRHMALYEHFDILMTPVLSKPTAHVGHWEGLNSLRSDLRLITYAAFTPIQNLTGQPAVSVPAGFSDDGMPQAVHLVAPPNDEPTLISLAAQIERERPWAAAKPPIALFG